MQPLLKFSLIFIFNLLLISLINSGLERSVILLQQPVILFTFLNWRITPYFDEGVLMIFKIDEEKTKHVTCVKPDENDMKISYTKTNN